MNVYGSIGRKGGDGDRSKILLHDQLQQVCNPFADVTGSTSQKSQSNVFPTDCYFRDEQRKIDFVLVYEEELCATAAAAAAADDDGAEGGRSMRGEENVRKSLVDKAGMWRQRFNTNLLRTGVHIEEERVENPKKTIHFYKIHVPSDVLCIYAEDLLLRAPLQAKTSSSVNWSERILSSFKLPNIMKITVPNQPQQFYTCQFKRSKMNRFLGGSDNKNGVVDEMFANRDRQRIAYEILARTAYGEKSRAEIGIDRLIDEGVYAAAFPLHDGTFEVKRTAAGSDRVGLQVDDRLLNRRQVLYKYWAKWGRLFKYQPLDHIREYFGEKISIYFAWLGFYTAWLLPASFVGVVVFLFGVLTMSSNQPASVNF